MTKLKSFLKSETVLIISFLAVIVSMFFVKPSVKYISYIDFRVLALLFCLMAVVSGFQKIGVFKILSQQFITRAKNTRSLCIILVLLCFFSAILITNDVALIAFVPFGIMVLTLTSETEYIIPIIVLQTIAANLGSMLTPIGNPQNLYLYNYYNISVLEFIKISLPITILALLLIIILTLFLKKKTIDFKIQNKIKISSKKQLIIYLLLFALCLATVFRIINYLITLLIIILALLFVDRKLFKEIDYGLLGTFICFFIFVGNIGNISTVQNAIEKAIQGRELISAVILSQFISNVPAAVLLSSFTDNSKGLILGSNIGGLGTLIASLASLISFKIYIKSENSKPVKYILLFSLLSLLLLAILLFFCYFFIK